MAAAGGPQGDILTGWRRLLVYGLIGPPVGGMVVLALFALVTRDWDGDGTGLSLRADILPMIPAAPFFGYVLGLGPALAISVLDEILAGKGWSGGRRFAACALPAAGLGMLAVLAVGVPWRPLLLIVGLAGIAATAVCAELSAWIDRRPGPRQPTMP